MCNQIYVGPKRITKLLNSHSLEKESFIDLCTVWWWKEGGENGMLRWKKEVKGGWGCVTWEVMGGRRHISLGKWARRDFSYYTEILKCSNKAFNFTRVRSRERKFSLSNTRKHEFGLSSINSYQITMMPTVCQSTNEWWGYYKIQQGYRQTTLHDESEALSTRVEALVWESFQFFHHTMKLKLLPWWTKLWICPWGVFNDFLAGFHCWWYGQWCTRESSASL